MLVRFIRYDNLALPLTHVAAPVTHARLPLYHAVVVRCYSVGTAHVFAAFVCLP